MAVTLITAGAGVGAKRMRKWKAFETGARRGGIASILPYEFGLQGLADNTTAVFATVVVPNAIVGASLQLEVMGLLGDGDSCEGSQWTVSISRLVGANAKIAISAKAVNAATAGATANCAVTIANAAVAGAVGAVNTFDLNIKVARSAGTSTNHTAMIRAALFNMLAGGAII